MSEFLTLEDVIQLMLKELKRLESDKTDRFKHLIDDLQTEIKEVK